MDTGRVEETAQLIHGQQPALGGRENRGGNTSLNPLVAGFPMGFTPEVLQSSPVKTEFTLEFRDTTRATT
jgi:hypothetical protein